MAHNEYVTLRDVEIGIESASGLAVSVEIDGEHYWVPLSQVRAMHKDSRTHNSDSIEVSRWWLDRNEIETE